MIVGLSLFLTTELLVLEGGDFRLFYFVYSDDAPDVDQPLFIDERRRRLRGVMKSRNILRRPVLAAGWLTIL